MKSIKKQIELRYSEEEITRAYGTIVHRWSQGEWIPVKLRNDSEDIESDS